MQSESVARNGTLARRYNEGYRTLRTMKGAFPTFRDVEESDPTPFGENVDFTWEFRDVDSFGVSRVRGRGKTDHVNESRADYQRLTNPKLWSKNIPETFVISYETADKCLTSAFQSPAMPATAQHINGEEASMGWNGLLFEVAHLCMAPAWEVTQFHNLLDIDFMPTIDPARLKGEEHQMLRGRLEKLGDGYTLEGSILLKYRLRESLTTTVLGIQRQGGVDVDSGFGLLSFRPPMRKPSSLGIVAQKQIRFSDNAPFSEAMNICALPWLMLWMRYLIVGGLEASPNGRAE
jgi:hypothetical protein